MKTMFFISAVAWASLIYYGVTSQQNNAINRENPITTDDRSNHSLYECSCTYDTFTP